MSKASIQITIEGWREEYAAIRRFAPGDTISGTITIIPQKEMNCKHVYLRLGWHTEGRGNRDHAYIEDSDIYQGVLPANVPFIHNFSCTLPREPWSFSGQYVSIVWDVAVAVDVPEWFGDFSYTESFVLSPYSLRR